MVGPRIYHLKHARAYPAFTTSDPAKIMDLAAQWLKRHDFHIKRKSKQYSRGSRRGIHVNFVPKFKLYIEQGVNGQYVVRFDYYAKVKLGTAVVVGVLTSGISTVVGVGTLAVNLADADHFVDKFWKHIDSLARGAPVILSVERWASDGKGNFVKQPSPAAPVVAAAMPPAHPYPPPAPHHHHEQNNHYYYPQQQQHQHPQQQYQPQYQPHTQTQPQYQPHTQTQPHYQPHTQTQPQYQPQTQPQYQPQTQSHYQPQSQSIPPAQQFSTTPPPQHHLPQYYAPSTSTAAPTASQLPSSIQPGQVYGNNHAIRLPQTMSQATPPVVIPTSSYPAAMSTAPRSTSPSNQEYRGVAPSVASNAYPAYNPTAPVVSTTNNSSYPISTSPTQSNYPPPTPASHNQTSYPPTTAPTQSSYTTSTQSSYALPTQSNYPPPTPASHTQTNYPPPTPAGHEFTRPPPTPYPRDNTTLDSATSSTYSSYYPTTQSHYPPPPPTADANNNNNNLNPPPPSRHGEPSAYNSVQSLKDADTKSYHGNNVDILSFNIKDEQGMVDDLKRRSGDSYNPWESQQIANTRAETMKSDSLYPQVTK